MTELSLREIYVLIKNSLEDIRTSAGGLTGETGYGGPQSLDHYEGHRNNMRMGLERVATLADRAMAIRAARSADRRDDRDVGE